MRRKVLSNFFLLRGGGGGGGVARFRILEGVVGGGGGLKSFACCKLTGALAPNQCQTITFLTLKTDNIAKLRIKLKCVLIMLTIKYVFKSF